MLIIEPSSSSLSAAAVGTVTGALVVLLATTAGADMTEAVMVVWVVMVVMVKVSTTEVVKVSMTGVVKVTVTGV
jgi:hypothetical protein